MSQSVWKLSAYFAERLRTVVDDTSTVRPGLLADQLLNLVDEREVATSVMLRGIASFGARGILRTDESLSLSEEPAAVIYAVDVDPTINDLVDNVVAMTSRGLVTLERAQLVQGDMNPATIEADAGETVKLSIYVGRLERLGGLPAYRAVCDALHHHGFTVAAALLGVDGTTDGERYRARFFSRNLNVPTMVIALGTASQASAAIAKLNAMFTTPLITIERIQLCKRGGELLSVPHELPAEDGHGRPLWQKLMVHTTEGVMHDGAPIHREIVRRLMNSESAQGATAVRGIWGFQGAEKPHGDRLFQLVRKVPVVTIIVDTPESIARSFTIVDELTAEHGVVTCEMVPAALSINGAARGGNLQPAHYDY